jgi:hypothetical protein
VSGKILLKLMKLVDFLMSSVKGTNLENMDLLCNKSQKLKRLTVHDLGLDSSDVLPLLKSI